MRCDTCRRENPADARFCGNCGAAFVLLCPRCASSNPVSNAFCNTCGQRLGEETTGSRATEGANAPKPETPPDLKTLVDQLASAAAREEWAVVGTTLQEVADIDSAGSLRPQLTHLLSDATVTSMKAWDADKADACLRVLEMLDAEGVNRHGLTLTREDLPVVRQSRRLRGEHRTEFGLRPVRCVVFGRDGRRVVSGGQDGSARLWDTQTGDEIRVFAGHAVWVLSTDISTDGRTLAATSGDATVRLWDVASGTERGRLLFTSLPKKVAFSLEGQSLLCSTDDDLSLWDVERGKMQHKFCDDSVTIMWKLSSSWLTDAHWSLLVGDSCGGLTHRTAERYVTRGSQPSGRHKPWHATEHSGSGRRKTGACASGMLLTEQYFSA